MEPLHLGPLKCYAHFALGSTAQVPASSHREQALSVARGRALAQIITWSFGGCLPVRFQKSDFMKRYPGPQVKALDSCLVLYF